VIFGNAAPTVLASMLPADARSRFTAPYREEAKDVKGVKSLLSHLLKALASTEIYDSTLLVIGFDL
jgi:hypothetical protein